MKYCTDIKQSKRLVGILPIDSADRYYYTVNGNSEIYKTPNDIENIDDLDEHTIPCWSLAALLSVISIEHNLHGYLTEKGMVYRVETLYAGNSKSYDNPIDACVDMIEKLYEQELL